MSGAWGIPVTANLLTGFLGAGKTSLLKRLLSLPELAGTAVLINEFGEVGLDHLLIEAVEGEMVLLKSGCVCCTIRGDLKEALLRLHGRRQRGEAPPFDRLVIETTGLADPAPIVATLLADPMLRHHFRLGAVVTVVDAVAGARNIATHAESLRQVTAADRLLISKIDLAQPDAVAALRALLSALNPTAEIILADEATAVQAALLTDEVDSGKTRPSQVDGERADTGTSGHHGLEASEHGVVRAFTLIAEDPLDWASFGLWLSMLLHRHGTNILRLKGLVALAGQNTPVVIQGVQHLIHKPIHLNAWPDGDRRTRLVVIAQGLEPALVRRSFAAFVAGGHQAREAEASPLAAAAAG